MTKFITFEGIDGAGKSHILSLVAEQLQREGNTVMTAQEPGTTEMGSKIRTLVKSDTPRSVLSELLLFSASRADMIDTVIKPAIGKYDYILLDRFTDSTIAYQGYGNGNDINVINQLNHIATNGLTPDHKILIDVSIETAEKRQSHRVGGKDRFECDTEFVKRVKNGYNELVKHTPLTRIMNENSEDETVHNVLKLIKG